MALITGKELFEKQPLYKAIPCFDCAGGVADLVISICRVLAVVDCPGFLASTPASIESYHGYEFMVDMLQWAQKKYDVTIAAHLDHSESLHSVQFALEAGFTSVMYDGSALPFEENLRNTRIAVEMAREFRVSVEGELGRIPGKEDEGASSYTGAGVSLEGSLRFVEETGIDCFAPSVGTAHGHYAAVPVIQHELVRELVKHVKVPLVLHGGSGLECSMLQDLISKGVRKVNFATEVREAFTRGVAGSLDSYGVAIRPQKYLGAGRESLEEKLHSILRSMRVNR